MGMCRFDSTFSEGLLWLRKWTFGLRKMRWISWLLTSEEGLSAVKLRKNMSGFVEVRWSFFFGKVREFILGCGNKSRNTCCVCVNTTMRGLLLVARRGESDKIGDYSKQVTEFGDDVFLVDNSSLFSVDVDGLFQWGTCRNFRLSNEFQGKLQRLSHILRMYRKKLKWVLQMAFHLTFFRQGLLHNTFRHAVSQ